MWRHQNIVLTDADKGWAPDRLQAFQRVLGRRAGLGLLFQPDSRLRIGVVQFVVHHHFNELRAMVERGWGEKPRGGYSSHRLGWQRPASLVKCSDARVRVTPGRAAAQVQGADPIGVIQRQLLGDPSPHGYGDEMRAFDSKNIHQPHRVVRHHSYRVEG